MEDMRTIREVFGFLGPDKKIKNLFYGNAIVLGLELAFLAFYANFLPPEVPLWYTKVWGEGQLTNPIFLGLLPFITFIIIISTLIISKFFIKRNELEVAHFVSILGLILNACLFLSLSRILNISSLPTPNYFSSDMSRILSPLLVGALVTYFTAPMVIKLTHKFGVIDDPKTHKHPAILHKVPIPRAGAVAFFIGFLASSLIFIQNPEYLTAHYLTGLYLGVGIIIVLGVIDDKLDLNPYLRLGILSLAILLIIFSGVRALYIDDPFNGVFRLDTIKFQFNLFGPKEIILLADIFSFLWILWVANLLSWSNGVDGQFSGIIFITALVIAILSVRPAAEGSQAQIATLAAATAGGALGLLPFTWHPAKIFWGFGAAAVGMIIAVLSIFSGTKVATASLILMVPLLDALYAIFRRVWAGKSPFFGDRAHLHHKLLDLGWSHQKIALFYWLATLVLGISALGVSGKAKLMAIITAGGTVGFLIAFVSLKGEGGKRRLLQLVGKAPKEISPENGKNAENR